MAGLGVHSIQFDELAADPGSPVEGQIWFNTTTKKFKIYRSGAVDEIVDFTTFATHASRHNPGGADALALGTPVTITDSTNADGSANSFPRSDHQHAHGNRGGGSLHADVVPAGLSGFMSGTDKSKLDVSAKSYLQWGNNNISATTTTRFLTPGYGDVTAQTTTTQQVVPTDGVLRNFRVKQNSPSGNGNSSVYTVRVNGVATSIVVTLASTAMEGSDVVNTAAVSAGDKVDVRVTKAVTIGSSPTDIAASLEVRA